MISEAVEVRRCMTNQFAFDIVAAFYCSTCDCVREVSTNVYAREPEPHGSQIFALSSQQERKCPICATVALFTASIVAASILTTVMFLHTRGSVLLAIVMHWSIMPGKDIARISFPAAQEPPDWLRAVVGIAVALTIIVATHGKLGVG